MKSDQWGRGNGLRAEVCLRLMGARAISWGPLFPRRAKNTEVTATPTGLTPVGLGVEEVGERGAGDSGHKRVPSSWAWNACVPAPCRRPSLLSPWAVAVAVGNSIASLSVYPHPSGQTAPPKIAPSLGPRRQRPRESRGPRPGRHTCSGGLHSHSAPGLRPQIAWRLYLEVCSAVPGNYKYGPT